VSVGDARRFWEALYEERKDGRAQANPVLQEVAAGLTPGTALELGCGRGDDAIWLALGGWQVTAVDIAASALEALRTRAAAVGVGERIVTQRRDLTTSFPDGHFDLIAAQYLHSPFELPRPDVFLAAANALAPGGWLLIVDHGSTVPWSWNQRPDTHFPTPRETAAENQLDPDRWIIVRADMPTRIVSGPDGASATVVDNVLAYRRARS
jgi:SAM-dependent methyltransferase